MADQCRIPRGLWTAMERVGLAPVDVLRRAHLPFGLHTNACATITTQQYFTLFKTIEAMSEDPAIGILLIRELDPASLPPAMLSPFYAFDYRDALMRVARFVRLCRPEQFSFVESDGEFTIRSEWLYATVPEPAIIADVCFASLLELGRRGTGSTLFPGRVDLVRPEPYGEAHRIYFGRSVRFSASRNALILKSTDLDRRFSSYNPELLGILTPILTNSLGKIDARRSIREEVKFVLKRTLASGRPGITRVARDLGISERTLQRRITEEGTSFRALLLEARQELGHELLSDPFTGVEEVAYLLGFRDAKSFYRAFRDQEGMTPSQWRRARQIRELEADAYQYVDG
ncbi:transcriptional regulator, AraC family [Pseudoxanthobacter soli DSM 19599]|uniref:Transcriptional regulator, AraC family n=1 Tax=Pseudoxanthobacter soli DSM 19599 TaxID=1123029 RepID=A0A1M7ZRX3_9HYPH|nr:AraC family transcriptional regulator [Pseudoxanthobacter soli]SHO67658.1 transcriptional regulator, AraC family [Pseudoxanthobacter soli DSM 19599]